MNGPELPSTGRRWKVDGRREDNLAPERVHLDGQSKAAQNEKPTQEVSFNFARSGACLSDAVGSAGVSGKVLQLRVCSVQRASSPIDLERTTAQTADTAKTTTTSSSTGCWPGPAPTRPAGAPSGAWSRSRRPRPRVPAAWSRTATATSCGSRCRIPTGLRCLE